MKLLVAKLRKEVPHSRPREHELVQSAVETIMISQMACAQAVVVRVRPNPFVDESLFPRNAKRLRKRPALQQ